MVLRYRYRPTWRSCASAGFSKYEVSEYGDVRRAPEAIFPSRGKASCSGTLDNGYRYYKLQKDTGKPTRVPAYHLVLYAFIGPRPSMLHEGAHKNGDQTYNHFSNLKWATHLENEKDKLLHGTVLRGSKIKNAKLTERSVRALRKEHAALERNWRSGKVLALAAKYNIGYRTLLRAVKRESWAHVEP